MTRFRGVLGVLLTLAVVAGLLASGIAAGQQYSDEGNDVAVHFSGPGVVSYDGSSVHVWASESFTVGVGPTASRAGEHYIYCLDLDGSEQDCDQGEISENQAFNFELSQDQVSSGYHRVTGRIHEDEFGYDNPLIEEVSIEFRAIRKSGDIDNDGVSNQEEVIRGTDFLEPDSDSDGLDDGEEMNQYNTDPLSSDTDNDGLPDGEEVNQYSTDPGNPHTDGDGLADGEEVNQHGTDPTKTDTDGDGLDDGEEVDRGSDPTDPDSPTPEQSQPDGGSGAPQSEDELHIYDSGSDGDAGEQNRGDNQGEESDSRQVRRGFFMNGQDSMNIPIDSGFITVFGFALSIVGIILQLGRGG